MILHLRLLVTIFFMTGFLQNLLAGWLWKGRLGRLRTSAWVFPTLMTRTFQRRKSNLRKYTKRQWETSEICFFNERWLLRPWSRRRNIQLENNHHHQFFSFFSVTRLFHVIYWWWNHILDLRTSHWGLQITCYLLLTSPKFHFGRTTKDSKLNHFRLHSSATDPLTLMRDIHLISRNSIPPESHINVMRIEKMIANSRDFWLLDKFSS